MVSTWIHWSFFLMIFPFLFFLVFPSSIFLFFSSFFTCPTSKRCISVNFCFQWNPKRLSSSPYQPVSGLFFRVWPCWDRVGKVLGKAKAVSIGIRWRDTWKSFWSSFLLSLVDFNFLFLWKIFVFPLQNRVSVSTVFHFFSKSNFFFISFFRRLMSPLFCTCLSSGWPFCMLFIFSSLEKCCGRCL